MVREWIEGGKIKDTKVNRNITGTRNIIKN